MAEGDQVLERPSPARVRAELEELVVGDLLGPAGGEDEELRERPSDRYLVGMLAPERQRVAAEELDQLSLASDGGDDLAAEPDAPPRPTLFPQAMGLTCAVSGDAAEVRLAARWGRYQRVRSGEGMVWRRRPAGGSVTLPLAEGDFEPLVPDPERPQVTIRGRARLLDGDWVLTAFLVNGQPTPSQLADEHWLFQVELAVDSPAGAAVLRRRPERGGGADPEAAELAMAYRDRVEFAVGHGIGVHAEPDPTDPRRATLVRTAAVPSHEVPATGGPDAAAFPALAAATLDMAVLAETTDAELPGRLLPLVEAYEAWVTRQRRHAASLDGHEAAARGALDRCAEAAARARRGAELLATHPDAAEAFRFANRAMWRQRIHTMASELRRADPERDLEGALAEVDVPANRSWRPFQLAFVLLNLPSLTDPTNPERSSGGGLVDLLWYPTGGGKTEAYLGLTAYVLALRRLQGTVAGHAGEGVAVLMRYTLRLLTLQQFQRAAALLCACERLRESEPERWGTTPFRVGLWIGLAATPNRTADAAEWVKRVRGGGGWTAGSSPAQLTTCPWCGSAVNPKRDVQVDEDRGRTLLYCGDPFGQCPFTARRRPGEGLPVVVVDEEVYRLLPALLIGTVDKFARMPWQGEVQVLFGRVSRRCERHGYRTPDDGDSDKHPRRGALPAARTLPAVPLRPPDLVVQDELHLIAGPLGSLVGLYETAVDRLCTWEVEGRRCRPKVVASSATVRRAATQAHQVFLRGVAVFPPPGLDAGDSFFARAQPPGDATPGRRYLGICAHGRRFKAALIRVFVAEMAAAQCLAERYGPEVADPYLTLVGYFNSLRELGGMRRLVEDDVASRLGRAHELGLCKRGRPMLDELTSRLGSAGIPRVLDRLQTPFRAGQPRGDTVDVLLATNMIAVGVDVPRLGAMVVGGQPKTTSEYIQATSRIGRARPGLVVTVLNWARPRDLSHYETFEHYHATFYRQVEALSVTPFAARALDRGLTGLLVSLVRLGGPWAANLAAAQVEVGSEVVAAAVAAIAERAERATGDPATAATVRSELDRRLRQWRHESTVPGRRLAYQPRGTRGEAAALLYPPGVTPWNEWTCLTSLRDVEPSIGLILSPSDLGEQGAPAFELPAEASP